MEAKSKNNKVVEKQFINFLGVRTPGVTKGHLFFGDDGYKYPLHVKGVQLISKEEYESAMSSMRNLIHARKHEIKTARSEKKRVELKQTPLKKKAGVIGTILQSLGEWRTKAEILEYLKERFTDRPSDAMSRTIQAQLSGGKETRLEREKGVKLEKKFDNEVISYKLLND